MQIVKRRHLLFIIHGTLAALMFAQGALVANACLQTDTRAAVFSAPQTDDCKMGTANPNLCLFQLIDQSDQNVVQLSIPSSVSEFAAPRLVARPVRAIDARPRLPPPGRAPPIPIRYCSLLI